MNKIVVKHTRIEINNYELGDCPRLENCFSIWDPVYFTVRYKCIEYNEEEKKLLVPRGIDVRWLEHLFDCTAYVDRSYDKVTPIEDDVFVKFLPRDDVQKTALRFIIGEGEFRHNQARSQLSVNLNTGKGKTYVSIASITWMKIRSAIICGSIQLLEQWKKCIVDYTDISPKDVAIISGTASIYKLLNMKSSHYKIFLFSHNTIKSYGSKYGWDKVGELFNFLGIGLKIYDEAHLNIDNICLIDFHTDTYKTLYLTATPARSDRDENDIYQLYFKNIPSIDLFDPEDDPRTSYTSIHFNSHPSPQQITASKNAYGFNRNYYTNYVVDRDNFYRLLHIIIFDYIKKSTGKNLIYIGTNEAILKVRDWIIDHYPEFIGQVGIYTTLTTENKSDELSKKIILSTTKSCGAAIDIKGLENTFVLAEPFKSEVLARQSLGRTRAKDTNYYEVVDEGFYQCKRYYVQKKPVFEKYATECNKDVYPDRALEGRSNEVMDIRSKSVLPIIKSQSENIPIVKAIKINPGCR